MEKKYSQKFLHKVFIVEFELFLSSRLHPHKKHSKITTRLRVYAWETCRFDQHFPEVKCICLPVVWSMNGNRPFGEHSWRLSPHTFCPWRLGVVTTFVPHSSSLAAMKGTKLPEIDFVRSLLLLIRPSEAGIRVEGNSSTSFEAIKRANSLMITECEVRWLSLLCTKSNSTCNHSGDCIGSFCIADLQFESIWVCPLRDVMRTGQAPVCCRSESLPTKLDTLNFGVLFLIGRPVSFDNKLLCEMLGPCGSWESPQLALRSRFWIENTDPGFECWFPFGCTATDCPFTMFRVGLVSIFPGLFFTSVLYIFVLKNKRIRRL